MRGIPVGIGPLYFDGKLGRCELFDRRDYARTPQHALRFLARADGGAPAIGWCIAGKTPDDAELVGEWALKAGTEIAVADGGADGDGRWVIALSVDGIPVPLSAGSELEMQGWVRSLREVAEEYANPKPELPAYYRLKGQEGGDGGGAAGGGGAGGGTQGAGGSSAAAAAVAAAAAAYAVAAAEWRVSRESSYEHVARGLVLPSSQMSVFPASVGTVAGGNAEGDPYALHGSARTFTRSIREELAAAGLSHCYPTAAEIRAAQARPQARRLQGPEELVALLVYTKDGAYGPLNQALVGDRFYSQAAQNEAEEALQPTEWPEDELLELVASNGGDFASAREAIYTEYEARLAAARPRAPSFDATIFFLCLALQNLPSHDRERCERGEKSDLVLFRGFHDAVDLGGSAQHGGILDVVMKPFLSTSAEADEALKFAGKTLFVITKSSAGVDVSWVSPFPAEREILFRPFTAFRAKHRGQIAGPSAGELIDVIELRETELGRVGCDHPMARLLVDKDAMGVSLFMHTVLPDEADFLFEERDDITLSMFEFL